MAVDRGFDYYENTPLPQDLQPSYDMAKRGVGAKLEALRQVQNLVVTGTSFPLAQALWSEPDDLDCPAAPSYIDPEKFIAKMWFLSQGMAVGRIATMVKDTQKELTALQRDTPPYAVIAMHCADLQTRRDFWNKMPGADDASIMRWSFGGHIADRLFEVCYGRHARALRKRPHQFAETVFKWTQDYLKSGIDIIHIHNGNPRRSATVQLALHALKITADHRAKLIEDWRLLGFNRAVERHNRANGKPNAGYGTPTHFIY